MDRGKGKGRAKPRPPKEVNPETVSGASKANKTYKGKYQKVKKKSIHKEEVPSPNTTDKTPKVTKKTANLSQKPAHPSSLAKFNPKGGPIKVLCVAEKPSLARSISQVISKGNFDTSSNGPTSTHLFQGKFQGYDAVFKFTSVAGHIYSCDFPAKYNNWNAVKPEDLFHVETEKKLSSKSSGRICKHLQNEAKGCNVLMLWLDCDREGENICFEVMENTLKWMQNPYVCRAKFSSIAAKDLWKAMDHLVPPNESESLSVDARQILDLKVGVAFTRFQSTFFHERYANLNSKLISYGPCQTPTLYFCVKRHDDIQTFHPEKFWRIALELEELQGKKFEWEGGRLFKFSKAKALRSKLTETATAAVITVSAKSKKTARPLPLNTVELLKIASSGLGMGPHDTMRTAESLYLSGYISYPRTETTKYAEGFDIEFILHEHANHPIWGEYIRGMGTYVPSSGGVDAGDHPPITPVRVAMSNQLSSDEWRLYEYITRHFLASISHSALSTVTNVEIQCGKELFTLSCTRNDRKGFLDVMPWLGSRDDPAFPSCFTENAVLRVKDVPLVEGLTSPPDYLTESELIGLMEKNGIGTDASIATHINNISERNYVHIGSGRRLIPNELGIVLIHGYLRIDPDLALPNLRSRIEGMVNSICKGEKSFDQVVQYGLEVFSEKFANFAAKIEEMNVLFESHFSTIEETSGKLLSKCGNCRRNMKYIALKPSRLFCMTCDETYSLPQNGKIGLYRGEICPFDGFEVLYYTTTGNHAISYPLCPKCFSKPPFDDIGPTMACHQCLHQTCKQSLVHNQVYSCMEGECKGDLVFDPLSAPNWRICCNSCNIIMMLGKSAHKVMRLDDRCDDCSAALFTVEFHKKVWDSMKMKEHSGCLFCDPVLAKMTETLYGSRSKFNKGRRGRRGRGRGRGKRFPKEFNGDPRMTFDGF